jgi:hypothetical protein
MKLIQTTLSLFVAATLTTGSALASLAAEKENCTAPLLDARSVECTDESGASLKLVKQEDQSYDLEYRPIAVSVLGSRNTI